MQLEAGRFELGHIDGIGVLSTCRKGGNLACDVPSASPTDTAARVDFHAAMVLSAAEPNGSAPTAPLSTEALLARPKATPSETVTDVPLPKCDRTGNIFLAGKSYGIAAR